MAIASDLSHVHELAHHGSRIGMVQVILLIGPAGSGKTTLGRRIAQNEGWLHLSEDELWNEIGHPPHEHRNDAGQDRVHALAREQILATLAAGSRVLFEFLVYEDPPRRMTDYQEFLRCHGIPFVARVLRPSLDEILARQRERGRSEDQSLALRRRHAEHQLACLDAPGIAPDEVIDPSGQRPEDTYRAHFSMWVEVPGTHVRSGD